MSTTIHHELKRSFKWYNKWHDNPGHHFAHWLIFLMVSLLVTLSLVVQIKNQAQAETSLNENITPLSVQEQIKALDNCNSLSGSDGLAIICDFAPSAVKQGGTVIIAGVNLGSVVNLSNSTDNVFPVQGSVSADKKRVTITVPATLKNGTYGVEVVTDDGTFASTTKRLTISDVLTATTNTSGEFINPVFPIRNSPATSLGDLIGMIFNYSLQILGLIVFLMILFSGFQWLLAGGNPGTISKARSRITQALLGAVILLASYLILNTINPDLVKGGFTLEGINTMTK